MWTISCRTASRFNCSAAASSAAGAGAVSLPYGTLFSPDTGLFKQKAELRQAFADVGITQGVPILAY